MKKLIPLMMCLVLSVMAFAQTGVDFQHLTFDEALAKAKAEKKLVFVDCYTTWCGPCKMMTTKIFPMKEAGEFFNPRFVCVKFDMEQGEGKELKNKLGVRAILLSLLSVRTERYNMLSSVEVNWNLLSKE
ncbi:MAG: thioredoxin family protein [Odoribacter splanchnicus]